jgi:L-asparaginase II
VRSLGLGIAIKVADGHARSLSSITVAILDQLGLIDAAARPSLDHLARPVLKNVRGIVTGHIQPAVRLIPTAPPVAGGQ